MRKILSLVAALGTTLLVSCKKSHVCECSYTDLDGKTVTIPIDMKKVTKKDAKAECESSNALYSSFTSVSCKLK